MLLLNQIDLKLEVELGPVGGLTVVVVSHHNHLEFKHNKVKNTTTDEVLEMHICWRGMHILNKINESRCHQEYHNIPNILIIDDIE